MSDEKLRCKRENVQWNMREQNESLKDIFAELHCEVLQECGEGMSYEI